MMPHVLPLVYNARCAAALHRDPPKTTRLLFYTCQETCQVRGTVCSFHGHQGRTIMLYFEVLVIPLPLPLLADRCSCASCALTCS